MLIQSERKNKRKTLLIIGVFILLLTVLRLLWLAAFLPNDQPYAQAGVLDLKHWNAEEGGTLRLDGEWEFFDHQWLYDLESETDFVADHGQSLYVPGSWNKALKNKEDSAFGFGTYRLRILVNKEETVNYSVRVSSVRSASSLYINGRKIGGSGSPGHGGELYVARNIPYSASFSSEGKDVIELVLQVANYKDVRSSGIVRSIKFGSEAAITRETQLSIGLQQLVAVVFVLHAIYAFILYLLGDKQRRLLYFGVAIIAYTITMLLGSEEKLLNYWIPIEYDWSFKLVNVFLVVVVYSLVRCLDSTLPPIWKRLSPYYFSICLVIGVATLFMSVAQMMTMQWIYFLLGTISIVVMVVSIVGTAKKNPGDNLLLIFTLLAFINGMMWWFILMLMGVKVIYYPFDVIISTTCFASVWLRNYFRIHSETRALARQLQHADQVKDQFLANTSHELRNPLHGILNISQSVLEREQHNMNAKSVHDLEIVLSVGRRMSYMLSDLLDSLSLKEKASRLHLKPVSLYRVVAEVLDMLQVMQNGKQLQLINEIPKAFPPVQADENRLMQMVFNLLHNAVKYTEEGEVRVRARLVDEGAQVTITDTGAGIDTESLRRIFEPYEQASTGKSESEGGFGLGLAIAKQLAEQHGGGISVESTLGKGSTFTLNLLLADRSQDLDSPDAMTEDSDVAAAEEAGSASLLLSQQEKGLLEEAVPIPVQLENGSGLTNVSDIPPAEQTRILMVDDDPINLLVLESILSSEPYYLRKATNGQMALEQLDVCEWDLIICDVMMPQMSGYELTRLVRERYTLGELPILLLTARSQPQDVEKGFRSGASDYVTKPVDAMELRARVKALTDVRQTLRQRLTMEAAWLQAQIQPHFLFNTLNSIMALSEIDLERMRQLVETFSHFLRSKFKQQSMTQLASLDDELSIVRAYLFIEQERFDNRLEVEWQVMDYQLIKLPLLTIQPLVENAVRHGVMRRARGGKVTIRIEDRQKDVLITVQDDGVGMDEQYLEKLENKRLPGGAGVGLLNTHLRLKRQYGTGLHIRSSADTGTAISFSIAKTVAS